MEFDDGGGGAAGEVPVSRWQGTFKLFGVEVRCHVLSDGRGIIEAESFLALLDAMENGGFDPGDLEAFTAWMRAPERSEGYR